MTDQEKRIISAGAEAIRNTTPSCDQAYNEAEKIFRVFVAMQQETMAIMNEASAAPAPDAREKAAVDVRDLAPPLEVDQISEEGRKAIEDAAALEVVPDHEAQEAARRAEQEAAIEAQLADASPLDAPETARTSRKSRTSKLDGQATTDPVSKLDK